MGELLSSTSTRYAEFTAAPSPHPSPPHSTQWFILQLVYVDFTELVLNCTVFYNYVSWCISLSFCFQGAYYAAATISCECDHNSGPTSTSANHHDIGPFQRSPNQHPSTLLGELAFFLLVITRVFLLQEERVSREKESMASESSSKPCSHAPTTICSCNLIYLLTMQYSWTFIFLIVCSLGLVGELLSSTSTRYAEFIDVPSPHPSPPHCTQWFNYYFTACIQITELVLIAKLYMYKSFILGLCQLIHIIMFMFSGSSSYRLM